MSRTQSPTARLHAMAGTVLFLLAVLTSGLISSPSSADTTGNPDPVVTATFAGQTNVAPPGTFTGLSNGSVITITVTSPGNLAGVDARQCWGGAADIKFVASFNPTQGGNCIDVPLAENTDDLVVAAVGPPNNTVTFDFRVGTGTRTVNFGSSGASRVITCDEATDCTLWLKVAVLAGGDFSGSVWKHYVLDFGADGGTTTTSSSTSSTTSTTAPDGSTTTSTTNPDSSTTTSTTAPATTTTSIAATTTSSTAPPTTTSTTVGSSTTSIVATTTSTTRPASTTSSSSSSTSTSTSSTVAPTTTLPAGTTVTPTVAPGGTIAVSSTGWKPGDPVTATLRSDPISLGSLTADATGKITGNLPVPSTVAPGAHELELAGKDAAGAARTIKAGVNVTAPSSSTSAAVTTTTKAGASLPATGASNSGRFALSGALLVAAGLMFVRSARLGHASPRR